MGNSWKNKCWGDLATLEYGKSLREYQAAQGPYPVYGTNGSIGRHTESLADGPGIIIGRKGMYRGVHFSPTPFFVIDTAFFLRPRTDFDMRWAYYQLLTLDINHLDSGSAIPSTSREDFYSLPVSVPPLPDQRRIAHILGTLDDKIELNRRMNRTLEKMAAGIFKSWFIDFDPVRAKAEGRDTGLLAEIADLFPDSFEDSELGEIPEGWEVTTLKELVNVNARSIKKDFPHKRIRYVDISSVDRGTLNETTPYELDEAPSRAKRLVQPGDTIWSCVRPNRKAYIYIDRPADNLVVSTGFAVLTPRAIPASYLYQWVTTQVFVDYLAVYATGAAYPAVRADTFEIAKMIFAEKPVLEAFDAYAGPLRSRIAQNQRQSRRLAGLRDTLLPDLMSGELELSAIEDQAEEVA